MLRDQLARELKQSMLNKDRRRLATVRLILAAVKERDIENRVEDVSADDDDAVITDILSKMVKQRNDSIKAYEEAGRCELAEREREEIEIIRGFLPRQLSDDEMRVACEEAVAETGAQSLRDIGKCMGSLKAKYAGQMDFARASQTVKSLLS